MSPRTPEQSQQIREERRTQIIEAALQLFAEKGLHDTNVSEIAARAGVSQGTVYWYFDSKAELFEAAFISQFNALVEPMYEIVGQEERPASDKLMAIAEVFIDLFDQHPDLMFVLVQAIATQEIARMLTHDFKAYYEEFKVIVAPLFEELGDPDPATTTSIYLAVLDGLMFQSLLGPEMYDRDRTLAQIKVKFNL